MLAPVPLGRKVQNAASLPKSFCIFARPPPTPLIPPRFLCFFVWFFCFSAAIYACLCLESVCGRSATSGFTDGSGSLHQSCWFTFAVVVCGFLTTRVSAVINNLITPQLFQAASVRDLLALNKPISSNMAFFYSVR